jgi:3-phenylpropionate/trans-cinnamate dioxygenase ferredoxin reductase subunit
VLKKKMAGIRECIVCGQGLSSLDLICGLHKTGKEVTFIIKGAKPEWDILEAKLTDEMYQLLKEKGIKIITEDRIASIAETGDKYRVFTLKQRELFADVVFAWENYLPNICCAADTTIEKKTGILVNEYLETSIAGIYAAGDCAEIYHPKLKKYWVNFGWPNALEQGEIAALNMTGQKKVYHVHDAIDFNLMGKGLKARWWK